MACYAEYAAVAGTYAAMIGAAVTAGLTAETVILTPPLIAGFIAAAIGYIASCVALGNCLADSGQSDEAAKMRQKAAAMQKDIDALKSKLGMN